MYVHYSDVLYLNMGSVCTFTMLMVLRVYILMSNTTHILTLMYFSMVDFREWFDEGANGESCLVCISQCV